MAPENWANLTAAPLSCRKFHRQYCKKSDREFLYRSWVVIVFLIVNLDEVVKVPVAIIHYKKYGWLRNITREQTS